MPSINLLDWRQERRERRKKHFQAGLGVAVLVGAALVYGTLHAIGGEIGNQDARNRYLRGQIAITNHQIRKINQLEDLKSRLLARMQIISKLEQSRAQVVHFFDQLVTTLPHGVHLTEVQEKGKITTIQGVADSNGSVSAYLRRLDASPWFSDPNLIVITAHEANGERISRFTLTVKNSVPSAKGGQGKRSTARNPS